MELAEKLDKNLYRVSNPERYTGNEWNRIEKRWTKDRLKVAVAFPDVYEIGMSHLGLKIIYHLLNSDDELLCERCYAPWYDMEELMKEEEIPLYSLENKKEISEFDIFAFTLQYEMSYTNILNMLDLANIPLYSSERDQDYPLVIGGGSIAYNPEPVAPFFDLFYIGEAEDIILNLVKKYHEYRNKGFDRNQILVKLNKIPGVYVPSLYKVEYSENRIASIRPLNSSIKKNIKRQIVTNLDQSFYPTDFIVPYMDIVHDRAVLEISRGCTRGCRFCVAGMTYRPVRERKKSTLVELADQILASTGYDEVSLTSLSTVDYSEIKDLINMLTEKYSDKKISISLSSLRVDQFSVELAREVQRVRKTGLTFAPEAGSQRLRNVINKGVNEEDLYRAARGAFEEGWSRIKLYFMIGLPTERKEDIEGIARMAEKIRDMGRKIRNKNKKRMKPIRIHVSVSTFIPKPFTPFQWVGMVSREEIEKKLSYLQKNLRGRGVKFSWNNPELSLLEGVFSRGDRRLAPVIENAWEDGARFDGWDEYFKFEIWEEALKKEGVDPYQYIQKRGLDETLPWDHINIGISSDYLKKEYENAQEGNKTPDCRYAGCAGCDLCFDRDVELEIAGADYDAD